MSGPIQIDTTNAAEKAKAVKNGELPAPAKTLAEALARIYADGGAYVQKTGRMEAGPARYRYAKEGDFIAAIRPLMETHGVTVRPVKMEVVTNEVFQRKSGGDAYRIVVLVTYELLHSSGDAKQVQAFGEGQDSGDKGFNKAMTGALKYALRQAFCVETGDDPDDAPSHDQQRAPAAVPPARQPQPAHQSAPARDNLPLRAKYSQDIATAKSRDALAAAWRAYDADVKGGKLGGGDKAALDPLFADRAKEFPAAK